MQLTQQIRIRPTEAQEDVLNVLSEKCRFIYNFALKERKRAFKDYHKRISYIEQQNQLPKTKE
ncbi:MAG: helix-turn-helix domain-containing protein [Thermoplasmata archaeon]